MLNYHQDPVLTVRALRKGKPAILTGRDAQRFGFFTGPGIEPRQLDCCSCLNISKFSRSSLFGVEIKQTDPVRLGMSESFGRRDKRLVVRRHRDEIPPIEGLKERTEVSHLDGAGIFDGLRPWLEFVFGGHMFDPVEGLNFDIVVALVQPDVNRTVAITAETGKEGYPSLSP